MMKKPAQATVSTACAVLMATLAADPAVSPQMRTDAENALRTILTGETFTSTSGATSDGDRIVSRAEAARLMNCSPRYATMLGKRGAIRKIVTNDGGERALGYSFKSIQAFISGKAA